MTFTANDILPISAVAVQAATSILCAMSVAQQNPSKHPASTLAVCLVPGVACGVLVHLGMPLWMLLVPGMLAACFVLLFQSPVFYAVIASLLSAVFFLSQRLVCLLPNLSNGYGLILPAVVLGSALLCGWRKISILPEYLQIVSAGNSGKISRFSLTLAAITLCLSLQLVWMGYLCTCVQSMERSHQIWSTGFTLCNLALSLIFIRRLAFSALEKIEALIDKQYQTELLNLMQIIRSQRHDFNFHMQALSGMIESKRYAECDTYIRQLTKTTSIMNDILPLKEPAVSAMINSFREMAVQKQIALDVSIHNDLALIPCSVYETNTLIGNLLQNAIDEMEESSEKKWINLLILKRGGDLIIKVTNPCSLTPEKFRDVFKPGFSTKKSHEGIGLVTVQRIVSKYDGTIHPEFGSGTVSFVIRLASRR